MKHLKGLIIAFLLVLTSGVVNSQIIPPVNATSNYTLTTGHVTNFYDPNGPGGAPCTTGTTAGGSYDNCGCFTTITINAAAGEFLNVNFNEFSMWNTTTGWDWMTIHDGPTVASPTIFDNSAGGPDNPIGDCGIGANVLDFCSTGNSMTFRFYATSVVNRAGWDATVSSISSPCGALPIELVDFSGYDDENVNKIYWTTASEINNDYFIVERSEDGMQWEHFNKVDGAGNSSTEITYTLTDSTPFISYTYYKLTQVDFDGNRETFDIISVENKASVFYVYHKEGDDDHLYLSSPYEFQIYDCMGRLVKTETSDKIYIGDLPSGINIIKVGGYTRKIIIN